MTVSKRSYFVSKSHEYAKPLVELLTDRLSDTDWRLTMSRVVTTMSYLQPNGRTRWLSSTTLQHPLGSTDTLYLLDGKPATLYKWLSFDAKAEGKYQLQAKVTVHEHRYQLPGTTERISLLASESGVYVVADCSANAHTMLSEYYAAASDSTALYSAVDEDGMLWELTESEDSDDYD